MVKQELRKIYSQKRKGLTSDEVRRLSERIHDQLFSRLMMHRYSVVHTFLPIEKNNEVDTRLIIETLRRDFPSDVYVPFANRNGSMNHHLFTENITLKENQWGIPEPVSESNDDAHFFEKIKEEDTLILIPLLIFDKSGQRVGYGKGFYDRFLAACPPEVTKVGLSFFEPVDHIDDTDEFDIPLNYCITPGKVWSFF
ncbi:5-formyltetrahydrofolate cyclo-ligase [Emticicia sp. CRIBPO]|uniref:5-formyltetrahydrofolate cyclo-ligase n=1 Tax=Emticicia sp. CRIBPO TaxID=2683258 RepID=UPI0014129C9A|nr:5-formyltetrahydrofolate cyclo-ligase [Emticicia sp. CRIBPO]NBA88114.1 5-formyltetrahydrofolate cyclo-ligase [Emticicia sp. CRIBPO]